MAAAIRDADARDIPRIMTVMNKAFDPANGEAWTASQCISALAMPGTIALLAEIEERATGFAIVRKILDEAELLLIAVRPDAQGQGVGNRLLAQVIDKLSNDGVKKLHLEMREENAALLFYSNRNFEAVGRRKGYYRRPDGTVSDAITLSRTLVSTVKHF